MKKLFFLQLALLAFASTAFCQYPYIEMRAPNAQTENEGQNNPNPEKIEKRQGASLFPYYNRKTEERIDAEIVDVLTRRSERNGWNDVAIVVKTDKGTFPVGLGPAWYIDEEAGILAPGERVKIIGSMFLEHGKTFMIAKEVRTKDYVLELRDSNGFRLWNGWRKS